jgi:catechol 2,3-dioxygenase-like lactoylglutathione lyase family enzyme
MAKPTGLADQDSRQTQESRRSRKDENMRIALTSIYVDDQDKAERFYTEVLGLKTKTSAPYGPGERWLTVVSPEDPDGFELSLHRTNQAVQAFQEACRALGRPITADRRLPAGCRAAQGEGRGVRRRACQAGVRRHNAVFDDTCGNLINLHQD